MKTLDELGPKDINITVVHPGTTRPERTINPELEAAFAFGLSIGRIIGADLVAEGRFAYA